MATPLDVRNRRREAQRCIRLALNGLNRLLDDWKEALKDGKKIATDITNDILGAIDFPSMRLGPLEDFPNIRTLTAKKIQRKVARSIETLVNVYETMENAMLTFEEHLETIRELFQQEQKENLLKDAPVFRALPLCSFHEIFNRIFEEYRKELECKQKVVEDFMKVYQDIFSVDETDVPLKKSQQPSPRSTKTSKRPEKHRETLEPYLQVHITAWMLQAFIDESKVENDIAVITEECSF